MENDRPDPCRNRPPSIQSISIVNLISGNTGAGIDLGGFYHTVQANFVGTNAAGSTTLGNGGTGVAVSGGENTIGGSLSDDEP